MPQSFGPYVLQDLLGRGGMGEVHRAWDTEHSRTVALKLLSGQLAADHEFKERFRREAFVTASLTEPHVIPIHRYGEIDGQLFLDMRLVEGESLEARLHREGALAPTEALAILEQIAAALDAAHAADLVHRDVKPSNILLTGRPASPFAYLVDFGIARSTSTMAGPTLTQVGSAVGTFDYMAPERFAQQPATPVVDVYALACVLYECVTGRRPFTGDSLPAVIYAHLEGTPAPPSSVRRGIPRALDAVLDRGLAKDPRGRPATAGELIDQAWQAVRDSGTPAVGTGPTVLGTFPPPPPPGWAAPRYEPPAPRRRRPGVLAAVVAAAVIAIAGVSIVLWQTLGTPDDPSATTRTGGDGTTSVSTPASDGVATTGQQAAGDAVAPAPAPVPEPIGDETADSSAQRCYDGILYSCDRLFSPDFPAEFATYGSTCGGRAPETRGACILQFLGDPDPPTGLGNDPALDALAEACFAEEWSACDDMWLEGDVGSFYESYGMTCGGRLPSPLVSQGDCERAHD